MRKSEGKMSVSNNVKNGSSNGSNEDEEHLHTVDNEEDDDIIVEAIR